MKTRACIVMLCVVQLVACKEDAKGDSDGKSSKKSDKSEKSEGSPKGPKDVEVDSLLDDLKCKKSDDREGCKCLRDFGSAKVFKDLPEDGSSAWVGYEHAIGGPADGKRRYYFLQIKSGKPSQSVIDDASVHESAIIDYQGSARVLLPENADEEADAKALVTALKDGSKPPKFSEAAKFVKTMKPKEGHRAMAKTKGRSIMIKWGTGDEIVRADGERVLIVSYSESGEPFGDSSDPKHRAKAFCSEVWKVP